MEWNGNSVESDAFHEDFMVKLMRRLSGNLIYRVFSIKTSDNLHHFSILWKKHIFPGA